MGRYVLRRLLQLVPVFLGTTFLIYMLVWAVPGDPLAGKCGARACPESYVAAVEAEYGLDQPVIIQYFNYLGNLLTGDFGQTFSGISVSELIADAYPVTIRLAIMALLIQSVIGLTAGVLSGLRPGGYVDNVVLASTLFLVAVPVFVTGYVLQTVLGLRLGIISPTVSSSASWSELIVPGYVLGSLSMAYVARLTRTSIAENMRADYVRTAVAKGLSRRRVVGVHLLRNSAIPVVTFLGADFGSLMAGAIVTEGIFNIRGIGGLVFEAIQSVEGVIVTGVVVLLVLVYLLVNLLVDVAYALLDPRIRLD
ncbi:ABC transporter permease [Pseudonocardia sp. HH130630-07]|uniref:ABC transporter permease n=1 Tax=Pseudonocardia sp. HH130630-07 TaxID=1690815 RepID=UPI000814B993|nr:ABC transporter permease [Pseudonocardia sp. HH130630-07]ANY05985.1 ABC transporter permease [Pseudonocardia sp. HH130630-07]